MEPEQARQTPTSEGLGLAAKKVAIDRWPESGSDFFLGAMPPGRAGTVLLSDHAITFEF